MTRWSIVLDPEANADAREAAWRSLRQRVRQPILFQLRRRIEGWRLTEDLADEVCERVFQRFAGQGGRGVTLRIAVERELTLLCQDHGKSGKIDAEFERDWAASLCFAALKELGRRQPLLHQLILLLYDRPEGAPPMQAVELAAKLQQPVPIVQQRLEEGRNELRRLYEEEIAHTVVAGAEADEAKKLLPRAELLLSSG